MTAPRLRCVCVLLAILVSCPLTAQVELNEGERQRHFQRIQESDEPVQRVVLPEQELVAWVPKSFTLLQSGTVATVYGEPGQVTTIGFLRGETIPGLGLLHAWELTEKILRDSGFLKEVASVRKIEVAGRPALEVTAATEQDGRALTSRLMLTVDPGQPYLRQLTVNCPAGEEDKADALLKGLLRDWTPVDQGLWNADFEVLRSALVPGEIDGDPSPAWTERNRLLAAVSKPDALVRPWAARQLRRLADGRPYLLLDGLLHHHPRVRVACLEALPDTGVAQLLALALRDPDPIVRFTAARRAADDPELAAEVLRQVLGVDHELARSGTFQLLTLLETRGRLVEEAFAERDQYPARSQALLASLLGEWASDSADRTLLSAWRRATDEGLRQAALGALQRRGHPEVPAPEDDDSEDDREPQPAPTSEAALFLRVEVPQPGSLLLGMRDLLDRLQLRSEEEDRYYRSLIENVFKSVEDSLPDPVSAESTGLDPGMPWRWQGWVATGSDAELVGPDLSVTVQCTDAERFLHQMVRGTGGRLPFAQILREGLAISAMLPMLPAALAFVWDDQRQADLGQDGSEVQEASEVYLALAGREEETGELWELRRLEQYRKKPPVWKTELTARVNGRQVTLAPNRFLEKPGKAEGLHAPDDGEATGDVLLDVDLAALLRLAASSDDEPWVRHLTDAPLRLNAAFGFDGSELSTAFSLSGLPSTWLDATRNLAVGELRAPSELLPADTLIWAGASLDAGRLAGLLRGEPGVTGLDEVDPERLAELTEGLGAEVGLAVVGVPEPAEDAGDAWLDRLVVYLEVDERAARRFLKSSMAGSRRVHGTTVYRQGSLRAARFGDFLVLSRGEQVLTELATGPRFSSTALYDEMAARSPAEVALVATLHVELFAQALIDRLPPDSDDSGTRLAVEFLRAFGPIVAWANRRGDRLDGRFSLRPKLLSEAGRERARRLVGYVGYTSGSIALDGFAVELQRDAIEQVELELTVADTEWSLSAVDAGGDRLRVEPSGPGTFELVSSAAPALPESSSLRLPIAGEHLARYLRSERGLGLREQEIRELAREIRADEDDPAQIVRAVIAWVRENLEYRPTTGTESTEKTLASRQADCTEFTHLTIALCRSLGIPARAVHGASLGEDTAILHRWAEVYLDRWYEIDPTNGRTRVPAGTLRLPPYDALGLASTPGNRLRLRAMRTTDGGLARRLLAWPHGSPDGHVEIAVSKDEVLVADRHDGKVALLRSKDRGERFASVPAPPGELLALLGGHGNLLWLGRGEDRQTLYALSGTDTWKDLTPQVRQELTRGLGTEPGAWSMVAVDEGFLVLPAGAQQAALLDPLLRFQRRLPSPPGLSGPWVLARDRPLVAHTTGDGGVALLGWQGQEWVTLVDFSDAAGLVPKRVQTLGPRVAVVCFDPERDRQTVLTWSSDTGKDNRRTPKDALPVRDSVTVGGWTWEAWQDDGGLVFSRRRPRPALP